MIGKCDKSEKQHQTKSITSTEAEIQLDNIKKTAGVDSLERLGNFLPSLFTLFWNTSFNEYSWGDTVDHSLVKY